MSRTARIRAFELVSETCPAVYSALDIASAEIAQETKEATWTAIDKAREAIKEQTNALREALIQVCEECEELRKKLEAAEGENCSLSADLDQAKREVSRLEREL